LYADYVSGKVWALKYDYDQKKVLANYVLQDLNRAPIISFGTDEQHEIYLTDSQGRVYQLERAEK
jgi:quinoprotein glucose dehydrogenase